MGQDGCDRKGLGSADDGRTEPEDNGPKARVELSREETIERLEVCLDYLKATGAPDIVFYLLEAEADAACARLARVAEEGPGYRVHLGDE